MKKKALRALSVLLALAIVFSFSGTALAAPGSVEVSVSNGKPLPGDTVSFTVSITGDAEVAGAQAKVSAGSALIYQGVSCSVTGGISQMDGSSFAVAVASKDAVGTLTVTYTYEVKEGAKAGETLKFSLSDIHVTLKGGISATCDSTASASATVGEPETTPVTPSPEPTTKPGSPEPTTKPGSPEPTTKPGGQESTAKPEKEPEPQPTEPGNQKPSDSAGKDETEVSPSPSISPSPSVSPSANVPSPSPSAGTGSEPDAGTRTGAEASPVPSDPAGEETAQEVSPMPSPSPSPLPSQVSGKDATASTASGNSVLVSSVLAVGLACAAVLSFVWRRKK